MRNIAQEIVGNWLDIAASQNELEVAFHRAASRELIASATDDELRKFAHLLHRVQEVSEEECYENLKDKRARIREQIESVRPL